MERKLGQTEGQDGCFGVLSRAVPAAPARTSPTALPRGNSPRATRVKLRRAATPPSQLATTPPGLPGPSRWPTSSTCSLRPSYQQITTDGGKKAAYRGLQDEHYIYLQFGLPLQFD